ncbi:MAG: RagB/SusD family nutrient uptake outer membrane protein [Prolixibacteraceae bacterium]|jgi:hypothetical protein|nr:RagB/SusD family nutrient uptake outer membrane protein [Prolixibacteraceae bacterium]
MKKIVYALALIVTFAACESLVEEEIFSVVTPDNFFKNEKDVAIAVNGVYDGIQTFSRSNTDINAYMAGEFDHNWNSVYMELNMNDVSGEIWNVWLDHYRAIGKANVVIDQLAKTEMDESIKNRYAGEVRFLRAFCYFNLVRIFGHVPLVKTSPSNLSQVILPDTTIAGAFDSEYLKQVEREDIYDFIVEELKFCEQSLPASFDKNNAGRVTSGAAKGMLARVYLAQAGFQYDYNNGGLIEGDNSKYALVAEKCNEIINSGTYALLADYAKIFENSNDNNNECLFSIQFVSQKEAGVTGEGSTFAPDYGIKNADITPYAYNWNTVNVKYFNDWVAANGTDDKRYYTTFMTEYVDKSGKTVKWGTGNFRGPITRKLVSDVVHPISSTGAMDYGDNFVVQRYSDVLLMHSEALNEAGSIPNENALMGVNMVRQRAGKSLLTLPITKEQLREEIWNERKWELCFEGFYSYFDCVRTGRYLDEIAKYTNVKRKVVPTVKHNIMPIPFAARQSNPSLKQNAGW